MKHNIILISGKQGSGKTTLANALIRRMVQTGGYGVTGMTFAGPLYEMHDFCRGVLTQAGIDIKHKVKDGNLLQLLGTEWGRNTISENVWVDIMKARINDYFKQRLDSPATVVISDCRFQNELYAFPQALWVRLDCPEYMRKPRVSMWRENISHPSEIDLDGAKFDLVLDTSGGVPVDGCVELVMAQLQKDSWIAKRNSDDEGYF